MRQFANERHESLRFSHAEAARGQIQEDSKVLEALAGATEPPRTVRPTPRRRPAVLCRPRRPAHHHGDCDGVVLHSVHWCGIG